MGRVCLIIGSCALSACFNLDASDKTSCGSQGDCVDGYVCLSHVCVSAGAVDAEVEVWEEVVTPLASIANVTGSGADDVWAGVSDGDLWHWDGDDWSIEAFCSECSTDAYLWQSGPDDMWAVDADGRVAHRDAAEWSMRSPIAPPAAINAIAGVATRPDLGVWAVGDGGLAMRWSGTWADSDADTSRDLDSVWAIATEAGAEAWAVGDAGTIIHFDGARWTAQQSGTSARLLNVWGTGVDDVWAVGAAGEILHYDGASWQRHDSGTNRWLLSVWGTARDDVWAAGGVGDGANIGTVLHFDGDTWTNVPTGLDEAIAGIWGGSADDVWFAGACGIMLHYTGAPL